ncbi:MAG: NDP-sugar synthase [Gemmatimonadetes bacterium]|nr:MAG: NDP-sugar synthase [Gemmatimonadota bacterium]
MKAMILAAGFGTRLRPLTDRIPKPLIDIGGKPLVLHIIDQLKQAQITEIVINLHYLGGQIQAVLGDGTAFGVHITYSEEPEILGTGGGVKRAQPWLGDAPFLIFNGDILTDLPLTTLIDFHRQQSVISTLAVREPRRNQQPTVRVQGNRVIDLREQLGNTAPHSALMHGMGIMICEPLVFQYLTPTFSDIITTFHLPALRDRQAIGAFIYDGYWNDIGTPEALTAARKHYARYHPHLC